MLRELVIPDAHPSGLAPTTIRKLRNLVAFFGKNGAGKSRLLRVVAEQVKNPIWLGPQQRSQYPTKQPWDLSPGATHVAMQRLETELSDATMREFWPLVFFEITQDHYLASAKLATSGREGLMPLAQKLVRECLGRTLDLVAPSPPSALCAPTLDGRVLSPGDLSHGQREICILIARLLVQPRLLRGATFLLDEVDEHLHHEAAAFLVTYLKEAVGAEGQIWLSSHSASLLARFDREEIWVLRKGHVLPQNSRHVTDGLAEIVDNDAELKTLGRIADEPAAWAATMFACQCLTEAETAAYRAQDPELAVIKDAVSHPAGAPTTRRVLDFGAGQGRLAHCLGELTTLPLKYFAYNIDDRTQSQLSDAVAAVKAAVPHLIDANAIITTPAALAGFHGSFDYVIMCGVLHEISPLHWLGVLSDVRQLLAPSGVFWLVEDQDLPRGEVAHEHGFLILGPNQARVLVARDTTLRTSHSNDPRYGERLCAIAFDRTDLEAVSPATIRLAIESLRDQSLAALETHRADCQTRAVSVQDGRKMAFLAVSAANATLALRKLDNPPVPMAK